MKLTFISVLASWLFATGVAVTSNYCFSVGGADSASQKKAEKIASRISKRGTISEYKAKNRHCSAIKKTTTAKVTQKEIKQPTYLDNPLYPSFTNALNNLSAEVAETAKEGDVLLTENGLVLTLKNEKPFLIFPVEYTNVVIGGVSMGAEMLCGHYWTRTKIDDDGQVKIDGIACSGYRRLKEPEFYCTDVSYSLLPSTKQVDAIRMHGDLAVGNTENAYEVVEEIAAWMAEDYGAVDLNAMVPAGTLARKKLKIGDGLDVEVTLNWKRYCNDDKTDARINISFTVSELAEDNRIECRDLGEAMDEVRREELEKSGVNYYTIRSKVSAEAVKTGKVY